MNEIFIRETLTQIADGLQSAIDCGCDIPDFACEVEFTTRTYEYGGAKFTVPFRFRREEGKPDSVPANPLLKMPVRDCGFETSIKNAFLIRGIETLSDLVRLSESDLLSLRNIGRKRIDRITEFLQQKNLHLKKDETHKQILNR